MTRSHLVQLRVSPEELAVLKANAGSEKVGAWLRRLGLEAGPVTWQPPALKVEKSEVLRAIDVPAQPNGPKPIIPPPADEDTGASDVPSKEELEDRCPLTAAQLSGRTGLPATLCRRRIEAGTWRGLMSAEFWESLGF